MNDSRLYVLTAFRAAGDLQQRADNATLLRLYAIDVQKALVRKFTVVWTYDVSVQGSISYMYSEETKCESVNSRYGDKGRPSSKSENHSAKKTNSSTVVVCWMTMEAGRLLAKVNLDQTPGRGGDQSFNLSVRDLGRNFSLISSGYSASLVSSIGWSNSEPASGQASKGRGPLPGSGNGSGTFWLSSVNRGGEGSTVLEQLSTLNGKPVGATVSLNNSHLTTPLTLVQGASSSDKGAMQGGPSIPAPTLLLVFGSCSGSSCPEAGGELVGIEVRGEGAKVLWRVPLPHSQAVVGQVATVDLPHSNLSLLILTTGLGVYAYTLSPD